MNLIKKFSNLICLVLVLTLSLSILPSPTIANAEEVTKLEATGVETEPSLIPVIGNDFVEDDMTVSPLVVNPYVKYFFRRLLEWAGGLVIEEIKEQGIDKLKAALGRMVGTGAGREVELQQEKLVKGPYTRELFNPSVSSNWVGYGNANNQGRVKDLQKGLYDSGYGRAYASFIDGSFGPNTNSELGRYQQAVGLVLDYSCGPATWMYLCGYIK